MTGRAECFVSGPLATVLRLARFLGIAPLRFARLGDGWMVTLSRGYSMYRFIVITINSSLVLWSVITTLQITKTLFVWIVDIFATMLLANVMVYAALGKMRDLITILNKVQKINSMLNIHKWSTPWTKKKIAFFTFWGMVTVTIRIANTITYIHETNGARILIAFIIQMSIIKIVLVVLHVLYSFKAVNVCLESLLRDNVTTSKSTQKSVHGIKCAYVFACAVVRDVNRTYGLIVLMFLSYIFLHILTTLYYCSKKTVSEIPFDMAFLIDKIMQCCWSLYHIFDLLFIVEPCQWTQVEKKRTRELVSRLMKRANSPHDQLTVELRQFCRQLELNHDSYKPLQVIPITRSLILTIFSSITTYLVILINIKV